MKRLAALVLGALAGVAAVRLARRRRGGDAAAGDLETAGGLETLDPGSAGSEMSADQASELRRKLDEARERDSGSSAEPPAGDETIGEARLDPDGGAPEETPPSGGEDVEELSERRAHVHERARDAAETMRANGDPGAA